MRRSNDAILVQNIAGAHAKEKLRNMQIDGQPYASEHGVDTPGIEP